MPGPGRSCWRRGRSGGTRRCGLDTRPPTAVQSQHPRRPFSECLPGGGRPPPAPPPHPCLAPLRLRVAVCIKQTDGKEPGPAPVHSKHLINACLSVPLGRPCTPCVPGARLGAEGVGAVCVWGGEGGAGRQPPGRWCLVPEGGEEGDAKGPAGRTPPRPPVPWRAASPRGQAVVVPGARPRGLLSQPCSA